MAKQKKTAKGWSLAEKRVTAGVTTFLIPMVTFVGIADGVVAAALLSGLPSTTCFALADAYYIAISWFSLSATACVATYILGHMFLSESEVGGSILGRVGFLLIAILFSVSALAITLETAETGRQNLGVAIDHCMPASGDRDVAARERIPLRRYLRFREPTLPGPPE